MFRDLEEGHLDHGGIVGMFEDQEEQREAAAIFHTRLPRLESGQEKEKAFHDILMGVKKNSYEHHVARMGTDVNALNEAIQGRKALEELARTHISLD